MPASRTMLIFGPTASGKTSQLGEEAIHNYRKTGKKTRLYTRDYGGAKVLQGHIDAGLIDHVPLVGENPWMLEYAVQGMVPNDKGKWVQDPMRNADIGHFQFEGLTSWGWAQMNDLATKAAGKTGTPINIGGQAPIRFNGGVAGDALWIGSNNQSHFGIVQGNIRDLVQKSFLLEGTVTWTSLDFRGEDKEAGVPIVAPVIVGRAGVEQIPSWFHHVFHLVVEPAEDNKPPVHKLYLVPHRDMSVGGGSAYGMANLRAPLGIENPLPTVITPASIGAALTLVDTMTTESERVVREKMQGR